MTQTPPLDNTKYKAALYMRLSKDDTGVFESSSIISQRKMLRMYAKENRFTVYDEYVDDGVSGTTFERAEFKRMIRDIEAKKVNLVITKDLSRLGREYIQTGQYTEIYFPSKKVRYIAINDGYDSESPYTDIAPFKNVINEMYARDTSKKIRSAFIARMQEGAFIGAFAPYGYKRDPNNKHRLVIDDKTAEIVRSIFSKAADGITPINIARSLNERKIPTPAMYRCENNPLLDIDNYSHRKEWTSSTITKMLRNIVYIGHMAQGKTTKISFKSNISVLNPEDDWYIVRNTHEPIVSEELFNLALRRSQLRKCEKKGKFENVFSGIAKCADCGRNMSTTKIRKNGSGVALICGGYKQTGKKECTSHMIDYDSLYNIVLSSIQNAVNLSENQKYTILKKAEEFYNKNNLKEYSAKKEKDMKKRKKEIDSLIIKIYDDYSRGLINSERLNTLLEKYEHESKEISEIINYDYGKLDNENDNYYMKFQSLLNKYTQITKLSPEVLFRFIDHIEVGQREKKFSQSGIKEKQKIKIVFRFKNNCK